MVERIVSINGNKKRHDMRVNRNDDVESCHELTIDFKNKLKRGEKQNPASELTQWPVQLYLVPSKAPYLKNADLVFAADCVPFAYPDFHNDFLKGKKLIIGCPKLDDSALYIGKLKEILEENDVNSLTLVHMEVPCCYGIEMIAEKAIEQITNNKGIQIPVKKFVISIQGDIKSL
jgi:hypothetical protein